MQTEHKIALCRAVGVLLLTDGHLTDGEYDFFYGLMDRLELDDEARSEVTSAISVGFDLEPDVALLRASGHGDELLEKLRSAATADGDASLPEEDLIGRIEALLDAPA